MKYLKDYFSKRWIRKQHCKLAGGLQSLGKRSTLLIEQGVELGHVTISSARLSIGAHSYIRSGCDLSLVSTIGRFCSIGSDVFIGQEKRTHPTDWLSSHPFQFTGTALSYEPASTLANIGHDVWIGHSAMIMEGVTIGTGAVVGTRAMVLKDVPPYAIVAGSPAKVIKFRHPPELVERLLASRWWELEVDTLQTLPLNDPAACLDAIEQARSNGLARYPQIEITRKGCRLL